MVYAIAESWKIQSWCFGGRGTPVLIPNTEVKPPTAEGTAQAEDQVGANFESFRTKNRPARTVFCVAALGLKQFGELFQKVASCFWNL